MYKKVAPILKPVTTTNVPIQGPKRKPPNKAIGEPKPKKGNTHNIVNIKKIMDKKKRFEFFKSKK